MRNLSWLCVGVGVGVGVGAVLLSSAPASAQIVTRRSPFASPAANLEEAARTLAAQHAAVPAGLALGAPRSATLRDGATVVRLPQEHRGLPVALRGATVTFDRNGAPRAVSLRLAELLPDDTTPVIDASSAAKRASSQAGIAIDASRATLALWPTAQRAQLAWIVYPEPVAALAYAPVIVIDARTGARLAAWNAAVALNQSQVYPSNPTKSPELVAVTLPVSAGTTTLQNELVRSQNCIDKKSIKQVFNLDVHTCDLLQTALPDANGDFLIPPGEDTAPEDPFSEVSMFHHANRAYDVFRGFQPGFVVQAGPLDTVSNLRLPAGYETFDLAKMADPDLPLVPFQNAFFAPSNPIFSQVFGLAGAAMWFGQGPKKDYSYDGDVIYHEFTHAVVSATVNLVGFPHADEYGLSQSPGGMNEGLADYFSSAIAGDPDVGEYAVTDFGGAGSIRSLTDPDRCPNDVGGEVHQDATLFSGSLWDVRATLAADDATLLDEAVFAAMNAAPTGDLAYDEMADLIIAAVGDSPLGTGVADALTSAFTKRGVLPKCTRVLEYAGAPLKGPAKLASLWIAPGLQAASLGNAAPYAPGIVQVHVPLPERTDSMQIQWKGVTSPAGGGGGLGGPQGTPFDLKLLVRFGKGPITFTYDPVAPAEGVTLVEIAKDGSTHTATVAVPPGTLDAHLMIANAGDQDGAYTAITIATTQAPVVEDPPDAGTELPPKDKPKANTDQPEDDSGCGCSVPTAPVSPRALTVALAALALVVRRRRAPRR